MNIIEKQCPEFNVVKVNTTEMLTDKYDSYAWIQASDHKTFLLLHDKQS